MQKRVHFNIQRYTQKNKFYKFSVPRSIHTHNLRPGNVDKKQCLLGHYKAESHGKILVSSCVPLVWPEMWEWCQMEAFRTEDSLFWGQNINTIKNLVFDKPCIFIKVRMGNCYPKRSSHFLHLALILWTSCCHIVFVTSQLVRCLYKTMTCYHGYQQYLFFFLQHFLYFIF